MLRISEEVQKIINEISDDTNNGYLVSLNKIANKNNWALYDESEEINKEAAILKAKEFISKYKDSKDFWLVTIEEGFIDWEYRSSSFSGDHYIYAISNKDKQTTENILDSDIYNFDKIDFLK